MNLKGRNFLTLKDFTPEEITYMINLAADLKAKKKAGEPENYEILQENELRPIINVLPSYESVYDELEKLVLHPERIPQLKKESILYVNKHHEYIKVAKSYEQFYKKILDIVP
mgnify:CR=1 FL=1